jgi:hypothetical protein
MNFEFFGDLNFDLLKSHWKYFFNLEKSYKSLKKLFFIKNQQNSSFFYKIPTFTPQNS